MCVEISMHRVYAVQCRAMWNQCMTRMVSTSFRLGVAETDCGVGLLCADSMPYMSASLENLQKKILSPIMCVEIFLIFFKNIQKCLVFTS